MFCMEWQFESQVRETVGWFVREAIPDPEPGWDEYRYVIEEMGRSKDGGRWWLVSYDIGTSVEGMDCWLSFKIVEPVDASREPYVTDIHAVRSGRGEHEYDVYAWDDHEGMWIAVPDDEDDE